MRFYFVEGIAEVVVAFERNAMRGLEPDSSVKPLFRRRDAFRAVTEASFPPKAANQFNNPQSHPVYAPCPDFFCDAQMV